MEITVEPGPGREPAAFVLAGRRWAVEAVLDRWPGSGHLYLKVRAEDGGIYLLRREDATGRWELWLFDTGADGGGPPLSGGEG
jgi:hypothetical protein